MAEYTFGATIRIRMTCAEKSKPSMSAMTKAVEDVLNRHQMIDVFPVGVEAKIHAHIEKCDGPWLIPLTSEDEADA